MYDKELSRVKKKINRYIKIGRLKNKKIILFGVSDNTRQIISILREKDYKPTAIIDNDKSKQGSYCSGLKVISPNDIDDPTAKDKIYIIYSAYWREMQLCLKALNVSKRNLWILFLKEGSFRGLLKTAAHGRRQYRKLIKKYGDLPVFLCPYTGTGDIYLIGTFWNEYIRRKDIDDYIFVVITGACKKVAGLFDIKNVELLKKKYYSAWIIDYYLYSQETINLKILNDCWAQEHTNQVEWFRGYKNLFFTELFRRFVFDLPEFVKPEHPMLKNEDEQIDRLFLEYNLEKNNTVVLSPYSNTLSDLPLVFWENIAVRLKGKGYCVVTNSAGKSEPVVSGTKGVFFSLNIAPQFIERAGFFIGIRSGFCDVISNAKAKKIILYDEGNRFYMGSAYEYFSLKAMQLSTDVIEYKFNHYDMEKILSNITKNF